MNFIHAVQALADAGVEFAIIGGWSAILHGSAQVTNLGNWDDIKGTCVRLPAFGREVLTLDLGSLIRAKRAAGRPKDLLVLPELESLLESGG